MEQNWKLPFLDLLLIRTDNDGLKFLVYRKPTHTDQYLNFSSHHLTEHKLSVIKTLMDKSQSLVSDVVSREREEGHVENAQRMCGYPRWSFDKVKKPNAASLVAIPYVERTPETVARIMRKHNVPCAIKPC